MFGNFSAYGVVREIQQESTQSGLSGTSVLIKVGEWQGQQGGGEDFVRVTLWRDKAEMAAGLAQGDAVSVSGYVKSRQNQRGFWNTQLQVTSLVCVSKGQQGYQQPMQQQGYQQQPMQQPQQGYQQQPYADDDIPFSQGHVQ